MKLSNYCIIITQKFIYIEKVSWEMNEKFITIKGHKIRYLESGKGVKNIVLIHGLGASAERWEFVIPEFSKHYRVIVPDLIGFGHSDKPLVDYTTEFFTDFISSFLNKLQIKKTNIIGSSLGGQIIAEYAKIIYSGWSTMLAAR